MVRAIVITGAPGAGKSSVLDVFTSLLDRDGIPFAAFETEQLGYGHPWLDEETTYEVAAVLVEALKVRGRSLFVVTATTETDAHIDALLAALAADETTVVCITAEPETTSRRVFDREPPEWHGRDRLVAHSAVLARQIPALRGIDLCIANEHRTVREVATELYSRTFANPPGHYTL